MRTRRRIRRKPRLIKPLLLFGLALSCLLGAGILAQYVVTSFHAGELVFTAPPGLRAAREIYPYSVIPGGVSNGNEVAEAIARDSVARAHYAGIRAERLSTTRANEPMLAYVSYRKNDSIHWTTHPVRIAKGEIILTDGTNQIRGRCGNRLALKRPGSLPASVSPPDIAPPDIVFEIPMPPLFRPAIMQPLPAAAIVSELREPQPLPPVEQVFSPQAPVNTPVYVPWAPVVPGQVYPWSTFLPPTSPVTPAPAATSSTPIDSGAGYPPSSPVVNVPEPGILWLLGAGLAIVGKLGMGKRC